MAERPDYVPATWFGLDLPINRWVVAKPGRVAAYLCAGTAWTLVLLGVGIATGSALLIGVTTFGVVLGSVYAGIYVPRALRAMRAAAERRD